jgi:hypothetical protein
MAKKLKETEEISQAMKKKQEEATKALTRDVPDTEMDDKKKEVESALAKA